MDEGAEFDWDAGNLTKCCKHGVSRAEIEAIFRAETRFGPDAAHSLFEDRFTAIGIKGVPRPIFVIFTIREVNGRRLVRPISARYMHREEIDFYA